MADFSHLVTSKVNIGLVQELACNELLNILDKCEGTKVLMWDESLTGPTSLIAKPSLLKERNVVKMFPIKPGDLPNVEVRNFIFITRPNLQLMNAIASNIHSEERKSKVYSKNFHLYFMPAKSLLCEDQLKLKGVLGSFQVIDNFKCQLFPFDSDVVSMEYCDAYKELYIEGDLTCLHQSAAALCTLQKLYGKIPKIVGKGRFAEKVKELVKTMTFNENVGGNDKGSIDQLIILDRSIDILSALATQLTYEGLIDEFYGINNTTVSFPAEKFASPSEDINFSRVATSSEKKQIMLNSREELYVELRDKNFNAVGRVLSRLAKFITSAANERHGEKTIQELKKIVETLPKFKANETSFSTHTTIATLIKDHISQYEFLDELSCEQHFMMCVDLDKSNDYIENMIYKQKPIEKVLRLICMQSAAGNGLKQKVLDSYKKEIIHSYGMDSLLKLGKLEKSGLIRIQSGSRSYNILRKTLNLTVEDFEDFQEVTPKDISYVHSFYAPLSIRIIEHSMKPLGWSGLNDILSCIPEPSFEDYQMTNISSSGRRDSLVSEISQSDIPKVILVFFIGGCTFAEISALRFLSQQEENNVEFVIVTTKIINKNTFISSIINQ
ncbi:CLUMA_CG020285, isoform A [Clunio marinus]|uniref:CLUMA_CG020285, isoform A n=1 Tax=Clunio marinus TaxID=568069 RepID=A0A1J1J5N9_9DIPT|nr:CLUMA_CG020285, isoform A [Clunio marinus]